MPLSSLTLSPLLWVATLLTIHAVAVNLRWFATHHPRRNGLLGLVRDVDMNPTARLALRVTYLTIPYLFALALRVGDGHDLGLQKPDLSDVLLAALIAIATTLLVLGSRRLFDTAVGRQMRARRRMWPTRDSWGWLLLGAIAFEAHWALFRAGPLAIGLERLSLAVFLALALLGLEAWSDPSRRVEFVEPRDAARLAYGASLAIQSALVFLVTGNTLACLAAHVTTVSVLTSYGLPMLLEVPSAQPDPAVDAKSIEPTIV